jgi:hypothetical protein
MATRPFLSGRSTRSAGRTALRAAGRGLEPEPHHANEDFDDSEPEMKKNATPCVCTENSNPDVMTVKPAEDRV